MTNQAPWHTATHLWRQVFNDQVQVWQTAVDGIMTASHRRQEAMLGLTDAAADYAKSLADCTTPQQVMQQTAKLTQQQMALTKQATQDIQHIYETTGQTLQKQSYRTLHDVQGLAHSHQKALQSWVNNQAATLQTASAPTTSQPKTTAPTPKATPTPAKPSAPAAKVTVAKPSTPAKKPAAAASNNTPHSLSVVSTTTGNGEVSAKRTTSRAARTAARAGSRRSSAASGRRASARTVR